MEIAHDGHQAIRAAQAFRPDLAILDMIMPKENGYRVSRRIKTLLREENSGTAPNVLLITGKRLEDGPKYGEMLNHYSMADGVLYKPIKAGMLIDPVRSLLTV